MRSLAILVWIASLAIVVYSENDFRRSGSVLQARQFDGRRYFPRAFPVQSRSHFNPTSEFYMLQRRADSPQRSESGSQDGSPRLAIRPGLHRPSSPGSSMARASIIAKGPAKIHIAGMQGVQDRKVPGGRQGFLHSQNPHYAIAGGQSTGVIPYGKEMTARAKGQTVVGQVIPPPGSRGLVSFVHQNGELTNIPITNRDGTYHTNPSFAAGGAEVIASTKHGGHVQAFAVNNPNPHTGQRPNENNVNNK